MPAKDNQFVFDLGETVHAVHQGEGVEGATPQEVFSFGVDLGLAHAIPAVQPLARQA